MNNLQLYYPELNLGSYNPEEGDLAAGFITDCQFIGSLKDLEGTVDSLVFAGKDYVCILTVDSGYSTPSISIHHKSVLEEIKERIVGNLV